LLVVAIVTPADAQRRQPHYSELTPEQQAAKVKARVGSIIAATTQTPEDSDLLSRNATGLKRASMDDDADDRARAWLPAA